MVGVASQNGFVWKGPQRLSGSNPLLLEQTVEQPKSQTGMANKREYLVDHL